MRYRINERGDTIRLKNRKTKNEQWRSKNTHLQIHVYVYTYLQVFREVVMHREV